MKKKLFCFCSAVLVCAAIAVGMSWHSQYQFSDVALANIEAIAAEEEGTPVSVCYTEGGGDSINMGWYFECDDKTSPEMIYPCPGNERFGIRGTQSLCTK